MQYTFNSSRFALRGWAGQGGVVYDEADSALYEVSESAFELLCLLKDGQRKPADDAGQTAGQTAPQLASALIGETAEDSDIALVTSLLDNLRSMGVVKCLAA
ncbi:MAG: hypothetical protein RBT42_07010 [Aquabacterium sp.]|jgi:hypothetical protein|uniref:hypothetical protein n=1 Tax=Aquabacterium sp. TaxID=1872578 RepID=UPI002A35B8E8|nr:hypothetical protein [Aquabacterium sp.]MDX9843493.1 hypothetical protein [Aquabacterium sp.]